MAVLGPGQGAQPPLPPVVVQPPVFLGTNYGWPIIGYIAKYIPVKIHETVDTRAAHFGPDVHEIFCRLGLRPRPHWGNLQRSPRPPTCINGPTSKGGRGREGWGGEGKGGEGTGRDGRVGRGGASRPPPEFWV